MQKRLLRPTCVLIAALLLVFAPLSRANLQSQVDQLLASADLGSTKVAVRLVKLPINGRSARPLIELNDDEAMIPASNQKLLTTAAALKLLGPDFVFRTDLRLSKAPLVSEGFETASDPALPSLIIHGDGDPAFGDPDLLSMHDLEFNDLINHWVNAVVETGIKHFGQLLVDDRVFDQQLVHPAWPTNQLHKWYCAPVAGLNFHDNVLHVLPQPAHAQGLTAVVEVYPKMPFLKMSNRIKTGTRDDFRLDRRQTTNEYNFFGTVRNRSTQPHEVTVFDPPILFAQLLQYRLKKAGIKVDTLLRPGAHDLLPESELLHRVQTSLPVVINRTNQESMNLFAEALVKRMGRSVTGAPGSWDNGGAAVRRFLTSSLGPGASIARVSDGSGMSRENQVTARLITDLLTFMYNEPELRAPFLSSLARAGVDTQGERTALGTLEKRLRDLKPGAHVYAKTGYINSVNSLSGYLVLARNDTSTPDVYAFSILLNGYAGKASYSETKALQDQIITSWQETLQGE